MDASVGFLLDNVKQLVVYHMDLIGSAETELLHLNVELGEFKAILEEASKKYKKDELFEKWEKQIREAVYDIEDIIDTSVTGASAAKSGKKKWFNNFFSSNTVALAEQVRTIREQTVKPLMSKFERVNFNIAEASDTVVDAARKTRLEKSQHIVGFEAETTFFVNRLISESDKLEVCSIIGMAGLGKTTLAWKIFQDSTIKFEFPIQIWVNVSDTLIMRKVLLDILSKFTPNPDESIKDEELLATVQSYLEEGKFLLVLDDVWKTEDWKKLKCLLPKSNQSGKVLITTRNTDVGNYASTSEDQAHNLRFLHNNESWELLQYEVFAKLDKVHPELVGTGKEIAINCKGLPLSIVVIGGILEEKTSRSADNFALIKEWKDVSKRVRSYLVEGDAKKLLGSILSLSYDKLPYELRNCFIYLGVFPEDAEIPVKKLIRLWIAEGFVQESLGMRLEEVALNNLKELIKRNLVMVRKTKLDGEAKICQVHDSIREICKREAIKLNLFQEVSTSKMDAEIEKARRVCIYSQALDFVTKKPKLPKSRSFICFSESPITLEARDIPSITEAFALLRVYDAKDMKFSKFSPKLVQHLHHLRYLTISVASEFNILPESVTNLWNLQTLLVDTPSQTLEIKGDIWKMRHLRHFKTKASIVLKRAVDEDGDQKLQTLSRLSPGSCTDEVCRKASDLITLGIQGDLRTLGGSKCLVELDSLYKLKLVHQVSRGGAADNPLKHLPDAHSFPPNLKILVLTGTRLDWSKMSIFSAISSLEVLKLKEKAFQGNTWQAIGSGFLELVCLHIERSDLMFWTASNDHFPKLRSLYVNNCERLTEIPLTLGKSLELLSLERVTDDAVTCAKEIVKKQETLKRRVKLEVAAADRSRMA